MKKYSSLLVMILLTHWCSAQTDTLKGETAKQLIRELHIDSIRFLTTASNDACKCIDSIDISKKSSSEITKAIVACIDKQVQVYELAVKLFHSMTDPGKNNNITINVNKNSDSYKRYYYDI